MWVAAAFLAIGLVTHLPGLVQDLFNSDEASLATMGMVIDRGGELYHETGDRKPPIVPYLYAAVFAVTGDQSLQPVRLLGVLALAATALLLAFEARRRIGSNRAGLVCGLLFLAGSVAIFPADSQAAGFETFMLLPMTAAVVAAGRGYGVLAGVCLALACLTKQTAVTTALPVAYLLFKREGWTRVARCRGRRRRHRGRRRRPVRVAGLPAVDRHRQRRLPGPAGIAAGHGGARHRHDRSLPRLQRGRGLVLRRRPPPGQRSRSTCGSGWPAPRSRSWPASGSSATTTCSYSPRWC